MSPESWTSETWAVVVTNGLVATGTLALAVTAFAGNRAIRKERRAADAREAADAQRSALRWQQEQLVALAEALHGHLLNIPGSEPRIVALLAALPRDVAVIVRRRFDPPSQAVDQATVDARVRVTHYLLLEDLRADRYAADDVKRRSWQERADVWQALIDTASKLEEVR